MVGTCPRCKMKSLKSYLFECEDCYVTHSPCCRTRLKKSALRDGARPGTVYQPKSARLQKVYEMDFSEALAVLAENGYQTRGRR